MSEAEVFEGGQVVEALGNRLTLRVRAAQTGGACGIVDFEVAPSFAAPPVPHRHAHEDWWGHVTEGELAIEIAGVERQLPTGATVFVPRGVAFRWWNPHARPGRWTLTWSPGGFESYFVDIAEAVGARPPNSPAELAELARPLWAKYGLTVAPGGAE